MDDARAQEPELSAEFGPIMRALAGRYFESVRFTPEDTAELAALHQKGFVVHVMRSTAWINYLYLAWAVLRRGLPPIRAVVNLRPWLSRPWRKAALRGEFDVRFTYARRQSGAGLIFLKRYVFGAGRARALTEDPFPALVAMARRAERTVFLVPELFVWEKWTRGLKPSLIDYVFGSPEAPGLLHTLLAFLRNYRLAQFRVGEPIDLRRFIEEHPSDSDHIIARKVRGALNHHLARETRAVFGPPVKTTARLLDETMRDRVLRSSIGEIAAEKGKAVAAVEAEIRRALESIAAKSHPTMVGLIAPVLGWVFNRIYDGVDIDNVGFERAMKAASRAPIVLVPSHKSHIDYLIMSYVLFARGYSVPLIAAGANLSFWPLGVVLRRGGAFFLRRSFRGDKAYTAALKAYVKKLVHDGIAQEFFPEGTRSRSGKLLAPKLGMINWEVEAVLEGARDDLYFVPVAIDYERVVESTSYSKELLGGEKKPEDVRGLLSTPKVLRSNYGRIHLSFDTPISLAQFMKDRSVPTAGVSEEQKRQLVRALGHRIMYGINRVSTVTPTALVASALLAHRRRGVSAREVSDRVALLRRVADEEGAKLSLLLESAPSDPAVMGAIREAAERFASDRLLRVTEAKGEVIYQPEDEHRAELAFHKNTLMNLVASRSLVAAAIVSASLPADIAAVRERALWLSRLFKFEFIYRVGASFSSLFSDNVGSLSKLGLVSLEGESLSVAPEPHAGGQLEFLANLLRDYLESYLVAALTLKDVAAPRSMDGKEFVKAALETGRAEFMAGRIGAAEALAKPTFENALTYFFDQQVLIEVNTKLAFGPAGDSAAKREELVALIRSFLEHPGLPAR